MRCHYEVLEIEITASESEIRSKYLKLARTWHPDKNIGNEDEADKKFKEINEAYEVLSNPQERAWYDSHREQILKGGSADSVAREEEINLWPYFSRSCFSGFGDDKESFYKVYTRVFKSIVEDEPLRPNFEYPPFGNATSVWDDTYNFYNFWLNFMSGKTFAWADVHNPSGYARKVRKLIEKENQAARDKEKKAYNDLVRKLAKHIKYYDPRCKEQLRKETLQREEQSRLAEIAKKEKQEAYKKMKEEFEREKALEYAQNPSSSSAEESEELIEFFCVACQKPFKTENSYRNHENSKAHKLNFEKMKRDVDLGDEIENELANEAKKEASEKNSKRNTNDETEVENGAIESGESTSEPAEDEASQENENNSEEVEVETEAEVQEESAEAEEVEQVEGETGETEGGEEKDGSESEEESEEEIVPRKKLTKAQQKLKKKQAKRMDPCIVEREAKIDAMYSKFERDIENEKEEEVDSSASSTPTKKKKRRRAEKGKKGGNNTNNSNNSAPNSKVANNSNDNSHDVSANNSNAVSNRGPTAASKEKDLGEDEEADHSNGPKKFNCEKCSASFTTRNKLFQHIKKTGHATLK